jgi:hypothetical protein
MLAVSHWIIPIVRDRPTNLTKDSCGIDELRQLLNLEGPERGSLPFQKGWLLIDHADVEGVLCELGGAWSTYWNDSLEFRQSIHIAPVLSQS